jgi:chromosome segregation ATPase
MSRTFPCTRHPVPEPASGQASDAAAAKLRRSRVAGHAHPSGSTSAAGRNRSRRWHDAHWGQGRHLWRKEASLPELERHILRHARAVAALPARFDVFEQRQGALEAQLGEVSAGLADARVELAAIRRLLEDRLLAETESIQLVGKLLQQAEARLDALEHGLLSAR